MALVAMAGTSAAANTIQFSLAGDHCTGNCGPQTSFGTIAITDVASNQVAANVTLLNDNKFVNTVSLPEPGSFLLLGTGLFAAAALLRRRARARSN